MKGIPKDILERLNQDFGEGAEYQTALEYIFKIQKEALNVGWVQLSRAIITLADGNINFMRNIIESKYLGDPRDVIMAMMKIPGNTNDHGLTPF